MFLFKTLFFQLNRITYFQIIMLPSQKLLTEINFEVFDKIIQYDYTYLNVSMCIKLKIKLQNIIQLMMVTGSCNVCILRALHHQ